MARGYRPKEMDLHSYDDLSALVKRTRSDMNKADDPAQN